MAKNSVECQGKCHGKKAGRQGRRSTFSFSFGFCSGSIFAFTLGFRFGFRGHQNNEGGQKDKNGCSQHDNSWLVARKWKKKVQETDFFCEPNYQICNNEKIPICKSVFIFLLLDDIQIRLFNSHYYLDTYFMKLLSLTMKGHPVYLVWKWKCTTQWSSLTSLDFEFMSPIIWCFGPI